MRIEQLMSKLFGFSTQTYFNWKKELEKRPILSLIEKYITKTEILEYIESGKIERLEKLSILSNVELENELLEKHIAYELRHKLYLDTASTFGNWLGHVVGMPVIHKALEEIGKGEYTKFDTKEKILNQIKGMELSGLFNKVFEKQNKNVASRYIERNLSELECYVWVKHYSIVTSYNKYWS
jgi:hypothetical protein